MRTLVALILTLFIASPTYGQEVTVEEIRSLLGGVYRQGYWHPVEIVVCAGREKLKGAVHLKAGKITFSSAFETPPESRRIIPLQTTLFDSDPSISVAVLADGEKLSFPSVAQQFQKTLTCVPPDKKLVAIIGDSPDENLSYLFKEEGVVIVQVACARVPTESLNLAQFDAVAVRPHYWVSLSGKQKDALEEFVRNGGTVFIPEHPLFPLPLIGKELERRGAFVASQWGLGKVVSPLPEPEYEKLLRSKDPQLRDDLIHIVGLRNRTLRPNPLIAPGAFQLFETLPPFDSLRLRWFYILCIYVVAALLGIGSAAAGIWKARYGISLFLVSLAVSSFSFAVTVPRERVTERRATVLLLHSGWRKARAIEFVSITCDSTQKTLARIPLGESGLVKPLFSNWSEYFRSETVLEQPAPAVLNVSATYPGQLLFQIDSDTRVSGGIKFSLDYARQSLSVSNRTGFDLEGCFIYYEGRVFPLGTIYSGQTIETTCDRSKAISFSQLISTMKQAREPQERTRGAILSYSFQTLRTPQITSLVGWRKVFPARAVSDRGGQELWLISEQ